MYDAMHDMMYDDAMYDAMHDDVMYDAMYDVHHSTKVPLVQAIQMGGKLPTYFQPKLEKIIKKGGEWLTRRHPNFELCCQRGYTHSTCCPNLVTSYNERG